MMIPPIFLLYLIASTILFFTKKEQIINNFPYFLLIVGIFLSFQSIYQSFYASLRNSIFGWNIILLILIGAPIIYQGIIVSGFLYLRRSEYLLSTGCFILGIVALSSILPLWLYMKG